MDLFDNHQREFTISPECPWYEAQQAYGAPNVNWCESTICSYINEPANTWSNLGYIIVAILIFRKYKSSLMKIFSLSVFLVGFLSGLYHATNNYLTQFIDIIAMGGIGSVLLALSVTRLLYGNTQSFYSWFWFILFANTFTLMVFDIINLPLQLTVIIHFVLFLVAELLNSYKDKDIVEYKWFILGMMVLVVGQISTQMDLKRIYCQEENLFLHGHVLWHLLGALSLYFMAFHVQYSLDRSQES
ncbi:MAG: ceramidase domain-containing protein [Bdellovibrionales bacterium]